MNKYKKILLVVAWALVLPVFIMGQVSFWGGNVMAADEQLTLEQQEALDKAEAAEEARKKELEKANDAKESVEQKIKREEKARALLQQNLGQTNQAISATLGEISKTKSVINETATTISRKEAEVKNLNEKIELQKNMLSNLLQQVYYNQGQPILNVVLTSNNFAQAFADTENFLTIEDKIMRLSSEITQSKAQIEKEKIKLAEAKEKHEEILDDKLDQKQELVEDKMDTQQSIAEKNAIIAKLQKQLAELQGDLNSLSGKSYNAKDIREAVEIASKSTGVPEGVLYGFLKMETNLGANTGKCTYAEVEKVSVANYKKYGSKYKASISLLYKRRDLFYALVDDLGYDKNKKVSCSPSGYIGQGGAMGIPQFMSDVWQGYSARITSATGHKTPDPWNLTDGVMAMAIKLKGAGATSSSESAIRKASINYLGTFHAPYYNGIVYWSKNYKLLFQ